MVPEGDGFVEVCAGLSNPAAEDVILRLSSRESDPPDARGTYVNGFVFTQLNHAVCA